MNVRRVLVSVSEKEGLCEFVKYLKDRDVEVVATEGTANYLQNNGIDVLRVSELTGFPEILGGRIKTLHPEIFGGILGSRRNGTHLREMDVRGIKPIDMVVINFRPFLKVAERTMDENELLENLDVGGLALLQASVKNYRDVVVVCDPEDYRIIMDSLEQCGDIPLQLRRRLVLKALKMLVDYEKKIYEVLKELFGEPLE